MRIIFYQVMVDNLAYISFSIFIAPRQFLISRSIFKFLPNFLVLPFGFYVLRNVEVRSGIVLDQAVGRFGPDNVLEIFKYVILLQTFPLP